MAYLRWFTSAGFECELPGIVQDELKGSAAAYFEISSSRYESMIAEDEYQQKNNFEDLYMRRKSRWSETDEEPLLSKRISAAAFNKLKQANLNFSESFLNDLNPRGALLLLSESESLEVSSFEAARMNPWHAMDYR